MEDDQLENKTAFRKMVLIIGGVVILAAVTTAFLIFRNGSKETFNPETSSQDALNSPTASEEKALFSEDITTWENYYWPGKINTHYPGDWQFAEEISKDGIISGLKIIPPTGDTKDIIFIGGDSVKCSDALKYAKSRCLKNNVQIPFYTSSENQEVLTAFDLIFQNTILNEIEK
ncbi:hypothetical protein KKA39_01965 [Patescibacteria group bacterium]|nr:hypothetical protein [Patescibacteria group bacterium]MBU1728050.1 hypothetical protein [Patescibacteria group bacterium]